MRDTIDMAREAVMNPNIEFTLSDLTLFKRFEALVRADEREQDIQRLSALVRAQQITIDKLEAQRQWVDLTNDEIALIHADNPHPQGFGRAVLAKSKEKNT